MVCVFSALKREVDPFLDRLENLKKPRLPLPSYEGRLCGRVVRVVRTGIGGRALDAVLLEGCELLVSAGWCGALARGISTGDVVVSTAVFSGTREAGESGRFALRAAVPLDDSALPGPARLRAIQIRTGVPMHLGPTVTSDRVVRTAEEKTRLHLCTSALSVDMEDRPRMDLAKRCGVPFVSVRAVLDELGDAVPVRRPGAMSAIRACAAFASLLAKCGPASRNLAAVLAAFVESMPAPACAKNLK
jgi:nucleoside phosphorylase